MPKRVTGDTPFAIAGIETLGYELAEQARARTGEEPDGVVITHAGGGNVTGTARGLLKAGCKNTKIIGASVDLTGLHMASDIDFNRKSFATGHTGFGVPFATWPDRADVPRNAARPLRYLDRYVTVTHSLTSKAIVDRCVQKDLLGKGAGHLVLKYALYKNIDINEAGEKLAQGEGWNEIESALIIDVSKRNLFKNCAHEKVNK